MRAGGRSCAAAPFPDRPPALLGRLRRSPPPGAGSREPLGTGHLRPQPGGESREHRTLPLRGLGCKLQTSATRVGRGVGARGRWQVGTRWRRLRAERRESPRFHAALCHLSLGSLRAAAFPPSAGSGSGLHGALARPLSVRLGCTPRRGPRAGPGGGDGRLKGWERAGLRRRGWRRDGGSERADE